MIFSEAIDIFIEDGRTRQLAVETLRSRRFMLERFEHYCGIEHINDVRDVTLETLLGFRKYLSHRKKHHGEGKLNLGYQNSHIRTVRLMFKLFYKRNLIMSDITVNLPEMHEPKRLPKGIMDKDQVMKLLQQPYMTTPTGFRDRTILEVLYSTALRGGELCRLTLYDIDLPARMIRVLKGKGKKDRVVPIGKVAGSYLAEYIKVVRPILLSDKQSSLVFVTAQSAGYNTHNLWQMIKRYRDKAHLPDNITTHSLRHTCATEMLKGGASIRHVQELLGHADIGTTQIYTHVVQTDLKKAHARTAPSERRKNVDVPVFPPRGDPCSEGGRNDTPKIRWNDNRNAKYWQALQHREPKKKKTGKKPKKR